MRARLPLTVALALATPLLLADTAKPRGGSSGSSSGSSHSSAGDRHPSPSSGGHSSSSASSGDRSSSHSSATPRTDAQARHPRPGTGHGYRSRGGRYYPGYGGYYGGYYGGSYYRYGYPYYYGYWSDSYYYPPYYPYRNNYRDYGSLRLLVEPERTRVYVDGYFAGEVDEFDGIFQRLNVSPGRHEIMLKLEGYRTHRVRLYVPGDHTVKLRHDMQRGEGEDPLDDRVGGPEYRWRDDARDDRSDRDAEREDDASEPAERGPAARAGDDGDDDGSPADAATLRLHVTPEDASIYVDGRFRGTGRQLDDLLMPPGKHRVEVVRPGFRTYDQELDVLSEEPLDVKIALERL